jgi:hypothetical protein
MKIEYDHLDSKLTGKGKKLAELNDELRAMDEVGARVTDDTLQIAEELQALCESIKSNLSKAEDAQSSLDLLRRKHQSDETEIARLQQTIEAAQARVEGVEQAVQVDLAMKLKKSGLSDDQAYGEEMIRNRALGALFRRNSETGEKICIAPEGVVIDSYEDFAILRRMIMENMDLFQMKRKEIAKAESGEFEIVRDKVDWLRLFSAKVISDTIESAVRNVPRAENGGQTLFSADSERRTPRDANGNPCSRPKFMNDIPGDYSMRPARSLSWLLKEIGCLYDQKWQEDLRLIKRRRLLAPLHRFAFDFAIRTHPLSFQAYQWYWDMYNSGLEWQESSRVVKMFMVALNEEIGADQLGFTLKCRDYVMKIGSVVSTRLGEQSSVMTEFYLNSDQIESALKKWWRHRYSPSFLSHIMEYAAASPAPQLDSTKKYVSMTDIMEAVCEDFVKDSFLWMLELLQRTRIVPRPERPEFMGLMKSVLWHASEEELEKCYRASIVKSVKRVEVSAKKFVRLFRKGSVLYGIEDNEELDAKWGALLGVFAAEWERKGPILKVMIRFFEKICQREGDGFAMKNLLVDAQRYETRLVYSLMIQDAAGVCMNYFELVFALDLLFSMLAKIDVDLAEASLLSLECCVKEYWLDAVFDKKNVQ